MADPRDEKTQELKALYPGTPYVVLYRAVSPAGDVDETRLAREIRDYRNRPRARKPQSVFKKGEI